jgi:oligopeptide transport system substrate-binding protein
MARSFPSLCSWDFFGVWKFGVRRLAAVLAIFACLLSSGCARKESTTTTPAQVLRISQRNEPADLDPATANLPDDFFVIRALGEGLLVPVPDGERPRAAAAERYAVSPDGLTYTFLLRPKGKWSNGEPVTADDFIASYQRVLQPATAAPKADLFFAVKNARAYATGALTDFNAVGFRALDERTLVISLERPTPEFPVIVASPPWIPVNPRTVAQHGRNWTQPANHVGNGPFRLTEWRSQQRIVVSRSATYHDPAIIRLDQVHFLRFDSGDSEERAYRAGQVDITMGVPTTKIATHARERPAELVQTPLAETRYLAFNTTRPPFNDPRVRRALSLAIDRERIVSRVLLGDQLPAGRMLPPPLRGNRDLAPLPSEHRFDPNAARALLAEAGFAQGRNFPRLELYAWSASQSPVLEVLQQMWRQELGVEVAVGIRELKVHMAALRTGDFDLGFVNTLLDLLDSLPLLADFTSAAPNNLPHWQNEGFDRIIESARSRTDLGRRESELLAAEILLLEQAPVAPIYFNTRNSLVSPRVRGWREDPLWTRYYDGVELLGKE